MDNDVGRIAYSPSRRHTSGGRGRRSTPLQDVQNMSLFEKFITEGNEKADGKQKREDGWTEEIWRR